MNCIYCGKLIPNRNKYCSIKCQKEQQYLDYIRKWKSGKQQGNRGEYQISMHIKTYLRRKYNNQCARCGWGMVNEYTGIIPLEVEHIDGDYTNNKEENLILLCPNCHSLTSTYKGANLNNGRKSRRKYKYKNSASSRIFIVLHYLIFFYNYQK